MIDIYSKKTYTILIANSILQQRTYFPLKETRNSHFCVTAKNHRLKAHRQISKKWCFKKYF